MNNYNTPGGYNDPSQSDPQGVQGFLSDQQQTPAPTTSGPDRIQRLAKDFMVSAPAQRQDDWSTVTKFLDTAKGRDTTRAVIEHAIQMGTQQPGQHLAPAILALIKQMAMKGSTPNV